MNQAIKTYAQIRAQAFESVPGSSEQAEKMAETDGQYWPESEACPYYGKLLQAENLSDRLWGEQANELVYSLAFADVVEAYGRDAVLSAITHAPNGVGPADIAGLVAATKQAAIEREEWRKERDLTEKYGAKGDCAKLAKLYPRNIKVIDNTPEDGIGWGSYVENYGGGAADTYEGRDDTGKRAIVSVEAGARPVEAMTEAMAAVLAELKATGLKEAEAAAIVVDDYAARQELSAQAREFFGRVDMMTRLPDTRGRTPSYRNSEDCLINDLTVHYGTLETLYTMLPNAPKHSSEEVCQAAIAKTNQKIARLEKELAEKEKL